MNEEYAKQIKFQAKQFQDRLCYMGDTAEEKFTIYCRLNGWDVTPFGWNRPDFESFYKLPATLRYLPDRVVSKNGRLLFYEIKGCGKDGIIKIKEENIEALGFWNRLMATHFFFYNSTSNTATEISFNDLNSLLMGCKKEKFPDNNKVYWCLEKKDISGWIRMS